MIDLSNFKYTHPNLGNEFIAGSDIPQATAINALTRAFDHVFSNEATSKVSTAKKKGPVSDEEATKIIAEAVAKYVADIKAGTWGEKGNRAVRIPGASREEQLYMRFLYEAVRAKLAKDGIEAGEEKDTFVNPDDKEAYPLSAWADSYVRNPDLGADREKDLRDQAKRAYETELANAEARKAAKDREASAPKLSI